MLSLYLSIPLDPAVPRDLRPAALQDVLVTADAMQTTRENARFLREDKHAHYLAPVLGVAAATVDTARGRIETRTVRILPVPAGLDYPYAEQALLIERYVTVKKNGTWVMRNCEAVLYLTSLTAGDTTPADLLAHVRGHWTVEHLHWLRDVVWREDQSLLRTGNAPQVMSALTNLVITLFRIQGVTRYTEETRRNAQNPRRPLQLLDLSPGKNPCPLTDTRSVETPPPGRPSMHSESSPMLRLLYPARGSYLWRMWS